jgi:Fe/S biogenesis protein NfuA
MAGFQMFIDAESAPLLESARVDFIGLGGGGFKIENPTPVWTDDRSRQVAKVILEQINPAIALHSGSITLSDVKDDTVYIRMQGGCQGCGAAGITLKMGIERQIKEAVPSIKQVVDITDHAKGSSPYYQPDETGESPVVQT